GPQADRRRRQQADPAAGRSEHGHDRPGHARADAAAAGRAGGGGRRVRVHLAGPVPGDAPRPHPVPRDGGDGGEGGAGDRQRPPGRHRLVPALRPYRSARRRARSSGVSMSAGAPGHGTSVTSSEWAARNGRAPASPRARAATSAKWRRPGSTGFRRLPPYVATATSAPEPMSARTASGRTSGWSTSAITPARDSAGSAASPARSEDPMPERQSGLRTVTAPRTWTVAAPSKIGRAHV